MNSQQLSLSAEVAAQELIKRRSVRASLIEYARNIEVPGAPIDQKDEDCEDFEPVQTPLSDHHLLLLTKLQETCEKPYGRLMVFMPPGSAKSTYASVVFPSWFLGRTKDKKMITVTYGDSLSRKLGRRTRGICKQKAFNRFFSTAISRHSSAADEWALDNGSEYMSAGILAGVTGNRADGIVIDDPVKGRSEANSEAISKSTWDAYNDDIKTRLKPGGFIVIVQTRWSEKDLSGRLLPEKWNGESGLIRCTDGQDWDVICLPAKCEFEGDPLGRKVGEYLWPEWFDEKHWSQFENSPITWASLYQQRPSPSEGGLFKPDKIEIVGAIPAGTTFCRAWDLAATAGGGDWTVGAKIGKTPEGKFIITNIQRAQKSSDDVRFLIKNTAMTDGVACRIRIPQDPGQSGKAQANDLIRMLGGYSVKAEVVSGRKEIRAEPLASQINVGNVQMLLGDWNEPLLSELRMFPNGAHDDQIDALSDAFNEINAGFSHQGLFEYYKELATNKDMGT